SSHCTPVLLHTFPTRRSSDLETMEALNDLVVSGKVRAIGASAMYGYQFYNMQLAARDNGWAQFVAMENHYNLLYREDEHELIPIDRKSTRLNSSHVSISYAVF